jgi:tetratricopeptide (TPR) repeat protein
MKREILGRRAFHFFLIAVLGLLVYSNTFNASFHFDDGTFIVQNPLIKDIGYFLDLEKTERTAELWMLPKDVRRYFRTRYVGNLTLWANYRLHGLDVRGYHAANLALHIVNAVLVYLLVALTLRTPLFRSSNLSVHSNSVALFSGLFFVAHPIQTEAVTYILSRFVLLVAMFYLLTLVLYIKARQSMSEEEQHGKKTIKGLLLYGVSFLACVLAMKTKENAFTLPVAIALYEFMFFPTPSRMRRRALFLVPFILTMLIIPIQYLDMNMGGGIGGALAEATKLEFSLPRADYLFTQFRVIMSYMGLLLFPLTQNFSHDPVVYHTFFTPPVFMSLAYLCFVLLAGIYLYYRSRKTDQALRLSAFGIFWFFLTLSVESSIFPIGGFLICAVVLVFSGSPRVKVIFPLLLVFVLGLSAAAYVRNTVWKTDISLWEDVIRKSPGKARGYFNLASEYQSKGMYDKAIIYYLIVIKLNPNMGAANNNIANIYLSVGMPDKAIEHYMVAMKLSPDDPAGHNNLGVAYQYKGKFDKAIEHYGAALRMMPNYAEAHFNLGLVYFQQGNSEKAREEFEAALRISPSYDKARKFLERLNKRQ